jgi:hypothetical protein
MHDNFVWDERLGISIPRLTKRWDEYKNNEQSLILLQWEKIRGGIPDRIGAIEQEINGLQDRLSLEENFEISCQLNHKISALASVINDLWLWYRLNQHVSSKIHG